MALFILLVALLVALSVPAWAHDEPPLVLREVDFAQRLNAQVPLDLVFLDEAGNAVHLGDYFGHTPVILVLAYYECPMLCPFVLDTLLESLRALSFNVGEQFKVITVSIDPRETVALAAATKATYLRRYARPGAAEGWHFLTGEEGSIRRLAAAVGFTYTYDAEKGQYAHATGIMVLTPQGRMARYFYGLEYPPRDLRLSLVEASANRIGSPVDHLLLFCYRYNPITGRYGVAILHVIQVSGLTTVLALGALIAVMARRELRKSGGAGLR